MLEGCVDGDSGEVVVSPLLLLFHDRRLHNDKPRNTVLALLVGVARQTLDDWKLLATVRTCRAPFDFLLYLLSYGKRL